MSDRDTLFFFMDGLQQWGKTKLRRRGVQDLATAIATMEGLVDFSKEASKPKDKGYVDKEEEEEKEKPREASPRRSEHRQGYKGKERSKPWEGKTPSECFIYGGPHWARSCPKKQALNSLISTYEERKEEEEEEECEQA